jgi:uncharacterized repeat protein (TIGR03943 family)
MAVGDFNWTQNPPTNPERTRLIVKTIILLGLGVYFVYNILSGNITNYINTRFAWLSYIAVALFFGLGGVSLYGLLKPASAAQPTAFDHNREKISLPVLLIVAIPLVLATLVPSRPLGVEAISGDLRITSATAARGSVVNKDPMQRDVLDWSRLFTQSDFPNEFDGQQASVSGFIYRQPDFPADTFMVARFTVSCCVADALPIGLPSYWTVPAGEDPLPDGTWVQVEGAFKAGNFSGISIPILQAQTITLIDQPEHPYIYP